MRAAFYEKTGLAREVLQVGEIPTPEPAEGEVRVRLHASGVNPSDVKMRLGRGRPAEPFPRIVPHSDGAGVIDAVGPRVAPGRIGERVWIWNGRWQRAFGTAADYIVLPAAQAVMLPDTVPFEIGACFGIPALTAWQSVDTDGGVEGQRVLVSGGAGAVGNYAIQFARIKGAAQILTTVSSSAKAEMAHAAGADVVINYKRENVAEVVQAATRGRGVDRIVEVDLAANIGLALQVLAPYGLIADYGSGAPEIAVPFFPSIVSNIGIRFFMVYQQPPEMRARAVAELTAALITGRLKHVIGARFALKDIAAAHEAVEAAAVTGNVVIDLAKS